MNLGAIAGGLFGGPVGAAIGGALFEGLTKPNSSSFDLPASAFRGRDGGDVTINGDVNINGGACGCSGAGGNESPVELATSLLEMAQHAEDPKQKADLIKAAIELLGGETGAEGPGGAGGGSCGGSDGPAPTPGGSDAPHGSDDTHVTSYEGESLKNLLTASGGKGRIGEEDGGYGVAGGKAGAEIDPGERLTFTPPADAGEAQGATVLLGDIYNGGPDKGRQETGRIIAKDADGNVVGVYDVQGQGPNQPGELSVRIDKPFATLEFESGGKGSDFTVKAVHVDHGSDGACVPAPSTPDCEPATPPGKGSDAPKTFSGDDLREWLSAEGGTVEEGKNGYSVENGANGTDVVSGEIDRGQSLTFTVPPGQSANGGGEVTLNNLYRNGPDGGHVEQAKVTFYDADGRVVDEKIVQGTPDGSVSVGTDKQFARVEVQPIDDGAGNSSDNSDFTLGSVTMNPASGGAQPAGGSGASEGPDQELLSLLGRMPGMIMETVDDPEQQSRLLDLVASLTQSLAGSGAQAA